MNYSSDIELAKDFTKGDQRAFEAVFRRFYHQLRIFAAAIVKDEQEAEDIVTETMIKLWKLHKNFDNLKDIRAFLYITVRNHSFNFLKSKKVKDKHFQDPAFLQQGETEGFVLEWIVEMEIFEMICREIDSLPPQRRTVLSLALFGNMTNKEIAEKMQLSINTIEATKSRAVQQIREIIFKKKLSALLLIACGSNWCLN